MSSISSKRREFESSRHEFARCSFASCASLPPLATPQAFEAHMQTWHAHACTLCEARLPSDHLLHLHVEEGHSALFSERRSRGYPDLYACFQLSCPRKFKTRRARKHHLVQAHHYPALYNFNLPITGLSLEASYSGANAGLLCADVGMGEESWESDEDHEPSTLLLEEVWGGNIKRTSTGGYGIKRKAGSESSEEQRELIGSPTFTAVVQSKREAELVNRLTSLSLLPESVRRAQRRLHMESG